MKKKRHRTIDPQRARQSAQGGLLNYAAPYPVQEKVCGRCEKLRYSVDDTGTCGYCRAIATATRQSAAEGPDPF